MIIPKKPDDALLALVALGRIRGVYLAEGPTGSETRDTFCRITGEEQVLEGLWSTYRNFLVFQPGYDWVAIVPESLQRTVDAWRAFEKRYAPQLAELARLRKEREGVTWLA